jgi:hypothetical protein
VPFLHALLAAPTDIYGDGGRERLFDDIVRRALGDAMEGMWQGFGLSSGGFAVGIHPELRQLDRELRWFGGMARAIMDDVVAAGPAHVVFPAVTRFIARVHEFTDLVGQTSKFVCTRMDDPASLAQCPHGAYVHVCLLAAITLRMVGLLLAMAFSLVEYRLAVPSSCTPPCWRYLATL